MAPATARVGTAAGKARFSFRVPGPGGAMRFNEKELQALSRQPAEMAAELGMRGPKKGSGERPGAPKRAAGGAGQPPNSREPSLFP